MEWGESKGPAVIRTHQREINHVPLLMICDHCGNPNSPASEYATAVTRRVPATEPGKKSRNVPVVNAPSVMLCIACAPRYFLSVTKLVEAVRDDRFELPILPDNLAEGTVFLTREATQKPASEAPAPDRPESLPLAAATASDPEAAQEQPRQRRGRATG